MPLSFEKIVSQLDLALDHLAQPDEDFARFALMLVDNVVEHALHSHAHRINAWGAFLAGDPKIHEKIHEKFVRKALGKYFEDKVALAKKTRTISTEAAKSILHLHEMRNLAYHQGISYAETIRSLTIFYFKIACALLQKDSVSFWQEKKTSYRVAKYFNPHNPDENAIWAQLEKVAGTLHSDLLGDLVRGMTQIIKLTDGEIKFCANQFTPEMSRSNVVKNALQNARFDSLSLLYAGKIRIAADEQTDSADPTSGWPKILQSLVAEKDPHAAVGKYCKFMEGTTEIREKIGSFHFSLQMLSLMRQKS